MKPRLESSPVTVVYPDIIPSTLSNNKTFQENFNQFMIFN